MSGGRSCLLRGVGVAVGVAGLVAGGAVGASAAEEEAGNNLSVPTVFVPSVGVGTPICTEGADTIFPSGATSTIYPGYYLQGEATWQADCVTAAEDAVTVRAEWGDNLTNAPLKQGTPIRTEVGLLGDPAANEMTGFEVVKLNDVEDRYADYGTLGIAETPYVNALGAEEIRVWNAGAMLEIKRTDGLLVYSGPFSAEINSTGRVVYGYNWQKPVQGVYTITFYAPGVALGSADDGELIDSDADGVMDSVSLNVNVGTKGGGGGQGGGGGGNGPGGPRG